MISGPQCSYQQSLQQLEDLINQSSSSLIAVIGCGCSTATEAVAEVPGLLNTPVVSSAVLFIAKTWASLAIVPLSVLQISYASSSASLNDKAKYANIFRTIPDNVKVLPAIASIIGFFGWKRVLVLSQQISATDQASLCGMLIQK